jgi:hypothetical protein
VEHRRSDAGLTTSGPQAVLHVRRREQPAVLQGADAIGAAAALPAPPESTLCRRGPSPDFLHPSGGTVEGAAGRRACRVDSFSLSLSFVE